MVAGHFLPPAEREVGVVERLGQTRRGIGGGGDGALVVEAAPDEQRGRGGRVLRAAARAREDEARLGDPATAEGGGRGRAQARRRRARCGARWRSATSWRRR